jgi:hypothetical protein
MAHPTKPDEGRIDPTPGIAGGPGPTPPGVEDGLPEPRLAEPESVPVAADPQREAGEAAERSAGTRRADVPELAKEREGRGDPGRKDPAEERTRR